MFAVLALLGALRWLAGLDHQSRGFRRLERVMVSLMGVLSAYWLIERTLPIFGWG